MIACPTCGRSDVHADQNDILPMYQGKVTQLYTEDAVAQARAEGRREGIEQSALVIERNKFLSQPEIDMICDELRALAAAAGKEAT